MHVKQIDVSRSLDEVLAELKTSLDGDLRDRLELDAQRLTYMGLLHRLVNFANSEANAPTVLLVNCTDTTLKQLRRIRRNQGKALEDLTVYTIPALSDGSEVSA